MIALRLIASCCAMLTQGLARVVCAARLAVAAVLVCSCLLHRLSTNSIDYALAQLKAAKVHGCQRLAGSHLAKSTSKRAIQTHREVAGVARGARNCFRTRAA